MAAVKKAAVVKQEYYAIFPNDDYYDGPYTKEQALKKIKGNINYIGDSAVLVKAEAIVVKKGDKLDIPTIEV